MSSFIFASFENNYTEILAQDLQAWAPMTWHENCRAQTCQQPGTDLAWQKVCQKDGMKIALAKSVPKSLSKLNEPHLT